MLLRLVGGVLFVGILEAQTPRVVADRPGFRNGATLVDPGIVQLETGFRLSHDRRLRRLDAVTIEPTLRVGVKPWLELRLAADQYFLNPGRAIVFKNSPSGWADIEPGIKVPLTRPNSRFRMSAIGKLAVPTGHRSQTSPSPEPGFEWIWERDAPSGFTFGGTVNSTWANDELGRYWQRSAGVSLSHEIEDRFESFTEVYALSRAERDVGPQWMFNAGISQAVGTWSRFDASAGKALGGGYGEWFLMLGFTVRSRTRLSFF